jgi:hypothetical protein
MPLIGQAAGWVPCGGTGEPACQFCHIFVLFKTIFDFILKMVGVIAALMFTIGGFMFFFAGTNPGMLKKGKDVLLYAVIGSATIFGAWIIINFILTFSGFTSANFDFAHWYDPSRWFSATCP